MARLTRPYPVFIAVALLAAAGAAALAYSRMHDAGNACDADAMSSHDCEIIMARRVVDASRSPWSAVGRIVSRGATNSHCTGTLIGENTVLTAAHCIHDTANDRWLEPDRFVFQAGYQWGKSVRESAVASYSVDQSYEAALLVPENPAARDWAILTLEKPIGRDTGFLKLFPPVPVSADSFKKGELYIAGYVRVAADLLRIDRDCVVDGDQSYDAGYVVFDDCPMLSGDSGGPLLVNNGTEFTVLGVNNSVFWQDDQLKGVASIQILPALKLQPLK